MVTIGEHTRTPRAASSWGVSVSPVHLSLCISPWIASNLSGSFTCSSHIDNSANSVVDEGNISLAKPISDPGDQFFGTGSADMCQKGSKKMGGNACCQGVKSVKYMSAGKYCGVYKEVVGIDQYKQQEAKAIQWWTRSVRRRAQLSVHLEVPVVA
ncbi:uncharacterized protein RCO7_09088 [Rhynchosporium graminicola]|uniref:Uncharacterized protein n=1 Tax=Rhynchosporium graminicola TaxID=2792576 RepID=A0A1E1LPK1_9HELO|nr:uncharacterized protein RCO7_09088 [Rhynchosporium commune]